MLEKKLAGMKAAEYIRDNMILGLGTGSTAFYLIRQVGELVKYGLKIRAVPTSQSTADLARESNIPLASIDEVDHIDLAIDGVDEIDSSFNAVKGGGGALLREKIVASIAREVIWIMDSGKLVDSIGAFPLPVEILPYGCRHVMNHMKSLSLNPVLRLQDGAPFVTDNQNYILDLHIGKGFNIEQISDMLLSIPGVIETGLFPNMCDRVIVGTGSVVKIIENTNKPRRTSG